MSDWAPFFNPEVFNRWCGPENVIKVKLGGQERLALLDTGCQVNMVTPELVIHEGWEVFPMSAFTHSAVHINGIGGQPNEPLDYVTFPMEIPEVGGYCEEQLAFVVPDGTRFAARVPVILGTSTIA